MRGVMGWALILVGVCGAIAGAVCVAGGLMVDMSSENGLWAMLQVDALFFAAAIVAVAASLLMAFAGRSVVRRAHG